MQLHALLGLLRPTQRLSRNGAIAGGTLALLYAAALTVQLSDHAFWRDEVQAWLIARASSSPLELRANLRFEGHPPLWHLVLWPFARASSNPELMKVVTFAVGSAFGAVISLGRAVPPLLRPVLLAGFLPIFGYGVLSRPYLLGLLLAFSYLEVLHRSEPRDVGRLSLRLTLLVLLSLTHLLFAVVAGSLLLGEILELRGRRGELRSSAVRIGAGGVVMILLAAIFLPDRSAASIPPPVDFDQIGLRAVLLRLLDTGGVLPAPGAMPLLALFAAIVLIVCSIIVSPRRAGPMLLGVVLLLINRLVGYGGLWWHVGVTTFAVVILALLSLVPDPRRDAPWMPTPFARSTVVLLTLLLLMGQVVDAQRWFTDDRSTLPYSSGREAAEIVRSWCVSECPVVVDWSPAGATVSAYLGAQPVHRLNDRREGTFALWDAEHETGTVSWDALRDAMAERGRRAVGVVSVLREPPDEFIVIGRTGPAVWQDEEFLVVVLEPPR